MSRVPPYSRNARAAPTLSPTGLSPATAARSSGLRLGWRFLTASGRHRSPPDPVQPRRRNGGTLGTPTVWACTVSLAATPAPSYFLRVHEMFQFPGLPPPGLCVHPGVTRLATRWGSPIRRSSAPSPRAAPRGISLLRHVLLRHERPRHPPDALSHGLHPPPRPRGRPRRRRPVPRPRIHTHPLIYLSPRARHTGARRSLLRSRPHSSLLKVHAVVPDCCLIIVRQQTATVIERGMVEMRRLELLTPSVQRRCSPN
jgi:hypothetical protein